MSEEMAQVLKYLSFLPFDVNFNPCGVLKEKHRFEIANLSIRSATYCRWYYLIFVFLFLIYFILSLFTLFFFFLFKKTYLSLATCGTIGMIEIRTKLTDLI